MAATALKSNETKEFFDSPEVLEAKLDQLAEWITSSRHFVAFTGAGISTSAGVPDFRSGMDTKLPIGAGVWTLRAHKTGRPTSQSKKTASTFGAIPSATHMLMVEMAETGVLKHVVSQNTDGLHLRSGLDPAKLSELHGNSCLELCSGKGGCGKRYLRDYHTRRRGNHVHAHETGRVCACGKPLYDSIVNFGESLPEKDIRDSFAHHHKADLCLAMGSSLRVTPAADCPAECAERGGKLVIVNLQRTPLDEHAKLVIHAFCDDVSRGLARRLGLAVPPFQLKRWIQVTPGAAAAPMTLVVQGAGRDGTPYDVVRKVRAHVVKADGTPMSGEVSITSEVRPGEALPSSFTLHLPNFSPAELAAAPALSLRCSFVRNYGEPAATFRLALPVAAPQTLAIAFQPGSAAWTGDAVEPEPATASASRRAEDPEADTPHRGPGAVKPQARPVAAAHARPAPVAQPRRPRMAKAQGKLTLADMKEAHADVSRLADEMKDLEM